MDQEGEDLPFEDGDASAWYAAAAQAAESDEEELEDEDEAGEAEEPAEEVQMPEGTTEDPYLTLGAEDMDPYMVADPYAALMDEEPAAAVQDTSVAEAPAAVAEADAPAPWETQRKRRRRGTADAEAAMAAPAQPAVAAPGHDDELPDAKAPRTLPPATPVPPRPTPTAPAPVALPPRPSPPGEAHPPEETPEPAQQFEEISLEDDAAEGEDERLRDEPVPEESEEPLAGAEPQEGDSWDEKVIVVRQGQIYLELQRRSPPMSDQSLQRFCDWLDVQLPLVLRSFPYIQKSGAHVDLSDNLIGPEGLDKLFRVLRNHRVPCVVLKCYRNVLDDAIVDTLIEYLYTQPEAFPMHGIHISHNAVTDKGAFRLIRAAASCGHYPRYTSRLPLWLRLECNDISSPQKVIADCNSQDFNVCLMRDGLCSRKDCNHYSGVHVQLPYFYHQGNNRPTPKSALPMKPPQQIPMDPSIQPDWMKQNRAPAVAQPAPKRAAGAAAPATTTASEESAAVAAEAEAVDWGGEESMPGLQPEEAMPQAQTPLGMTSVARPPRPMPTSAARPAPPTWPSGGNKGGGWAGAKGGWKGAKAGEGWRPQGAWNSDGGGWRNGGGGNWKNSDGGKSKGKGKGDSGKGKGKGKGGGGGWNSQMWQGQALVAKRKAEVTLSEADLQLGFSFQVAEGRPPQVLSVVPGSKVATVAGPGDSLLRLNGLDAGMFTEKQVNDVMRQRPLTLRFGDA